MPKKQTGKRPIRKEKKSNPEKEIRILEAALQVFGEKGFDATTISAISKAAQISDATLYEYFNSKEEVLFSIPALYTERELERLKDLEHYVHCPREKMRVFIQAYLEFYENNPLYTSVALLTLKGNRNFLKSPSYQVVREASRPVVRAFEQGVSQGVFRDDVDGYLVRNLVIGFIEHLTIQWLLVGRPESIADQRDILFDMVMGAIEKKQEEEVLEVVLKRSRPEVAKTP